MENHTMFSSLQQTPSFPYETDKIQLYSHLEILASVSRQWHQHRNRYANLIFLYNIYVNRL